VVDVVGTGARTDLFSKLKQELEVHEAIEEGIFDPALKQHAGAHAEAKEIVLDASTTT
jgi:hypothetical protein